MRAHYDLPVSLDVLGDWQAELERTLGVSPPREMGSGRLSWPLLVWVPGDDWDHVERFVVYDMLPAQVLYEGAERRRRMGIPEHENQDQFWIDQLSGPHPRQRGRWDQVLKQFIPDPDCLIDRYQWQLWRQHKAMGHPFWVIQGSQGGHLLHYTGEEERVAKLASLPASPPNPGALPYAPFDRRVVKQLTLLNELRVMRLTLALNGASWSQANAGAYRDTITAGTRTLLTGIDEYWHDAIHGSRVDFGDVPRVQDGPDAVELNERMDEHILTNI